MTPGEFMLRMANGATPAELLKEFEHQVYGEAFAKGYSFGCECGASHVAQQIRASDDFLNEAAQEQAADIADHVYDVIPEDGHP